MYTTDVWRIMAPTKGIRNYLPSQVKFRLGSRIKHSFSLDEHIERVWDEEIKISEKNGTPLTNGPLIRLDNLREFNGNLILSVNLTNYREYKPTCLPKNKEKFEKLYGRKITKAESASTFASETLPITLDNYVVFLERTGKVDEFKDLLSLPSGGRWDGNPIDTYFAMLESSEELFKRCRKIVKNEFFSKIHVKEETHRLLGVSDTFKYDDYALLFSISLDSDYDNIKRKERDILYNNNKYQNLELIEFEEAKFADFLNKNLERIPDTIQPVIIMAGAYNFGEDWPLSIKGVRKIED